MEDWKVGFAFCGSFCTYDSAMAALEAVHRRWKDVTPIISERSAATDTRFGCAHDFMKEMQRLITKSISDISLNFQLSPFAAARYSRLEIFAPSFLYCSRTLSPCC